MMTATARPRWTPGVDLFSEADELNIQPIQFIEHIEEVLHGPFNPVRGPDRSNLEPAPARILHHFAETRPPGLGAADSIGVFPNDLVAALVVI